MCRECFVRDEFQKLPCLEKSGLINLPADPGGRNVQGVGLELLDYLNRGFESR
jgi:hypothetical protein